MENREIDALIAEKLFNWEWNKVNDDRQMLVPPLDNERRFWTGMWENNGIPHYLPRYSTNITDAWEIVEKLHLTITPKWKVFKTNTSGTHGDTRWIGTTNNQVWSKHDSLPMAICKAALKSVGIII